MGLVPECGLFGIKSKLFSSSLACFTTNKKKTFEKCLDSHYSTALQIKNDSKKLAELREKAMKSAADFNRELQLTKKLERQHYWDVQTSVSRRLF